eukprot:1490736-Rhodomonas_salina.1
MKEEIECAKRSFQRLAAFLETVRDKHGKGSSGDGAEGAASGGDGAHHGAAAASGSGGSAAAASGSGASPGL